MSEEKNEIKQLKEKLFYEPKNGYTRIDESEVSECYSFCEGYKNAMNKAKTEREFSSLTVELAKAAGFREYKKGEPLKTGDKIYKLNRCKSIMLAVIGKSSLENGANIIAAHIDSPRLDLKPNPLKEDNGIVYFKTHYYGGIKKYQWVTIPLELRGVVALKNGETLKVSIGGEKGDPLFTITDLLPHLGADQMKKTLAEGITGESLSILLGSKPMGSESEASAKLSIMRILNGKYGITEEDFLSAEICAVPAFSASDVGLDRTFIGAYGHDDRVCAYTALRAILDINTPEKTAVCVLADKEEIGSMGVSGMQSLAFDTFMSDICAQQNVELNHCFENSFCLSADVSNAFDPIYPEVSDLQNNSKVNYGIAICKYTGARGKSGASDASAEAMAKLRRDFDDNNVIWQTAELGKVDKGGGGTVAMFMANRNIVTVDAGVPVLSMHAPYEVVAKLDVYMAYKAAKAVMK